MIRFDKKLQIFSSDLIQYSSGFSTKADGDGRDKNMRVDLIKKIETPFKTVVIPHQCHSVDVNVVTTSDIHSEVTLTDRCDAVVTTENGVALTVITADCCPLIYSDAENGVIAISHQGWKGTLGMLPQKVVSQMITCGANIDSIRCALGPTINECCYELYGERLTQFQDSFGETVLSERDDKAFLNLIKANYLTLLNSGVKKENIDFFPFCTSCNEEQFWSNQRDKGIKGEMVTFVIK